MQNQHKPYTKFISEIILQTADFQQKTLQAYPNLQGFYMF
jgi:hypothetical protein